MIKNLNYEIFGSGETTIVLLHGWGLDKSSFDRLIPNLDQKFQILSLDFFGFGESDNPEDWFDTYEYSYYVFLLLKKLQINNVILVGHSFGGRVASILSSVFDVNIIKLILTSSAGIRKFSLIRFLKIKKYKLIKKLVKLKILSHKYLQKFGSDDYKKLNRVSQKIFIKIINQDLKFLLKNINCKTVLVWDKKDEVTKYAECKVFNKLIKKSKIVLFNNGGHFCYLYNINKISLIING